MMPVPCCCNICTVFRDYFDRADETIEDTDDSTNWTITAGGDWEIASQVLVCSSESTGGKTIRLNQTLPRQFSVRFRIKVSSASYPVFLIYEANDGVTSKKLGLSIQAASGSGGCAEVSFADFGSGSPVDITPVYLFNGIPVNDWFDVTLCYSAEQFHVNATITGTAEAQSLQYLGWDTPVDPLTINSLFFFVPQTISDGQQVLSIDDLVISRTKTFDFDESGDYGAAESCPCCNVSLCARAEDDFSAASIDCRWTQNGAWTLNTTDDTIETEDAGATLIWEGDYHGLDKECRVEQYGSIRVRATFKLDTGGSLGVLFDYVDSSNYHIAVLDITNDLLIVARIVGGSTDEVLLSESVTLAVDTYYTLAACINDDGEIYVRYDGATREIDDSYRLGGKKWGVSVSGNTGLATVTSAMATRGMDSGECPTCFSDDENDGEQGGGQVASVPCTRCDDDTPEYMLARLDLGQAVDNSSPACYPWNTTDTGGLDRTTIRDACTPANRTWVLTRSEFGPNCGCQWVLTIPDDYNGELLVEDGEDFVLVDTPWVRGMTVEIGDPPEVYRVMGKPTPFPWEAVIHESYGDYDNVPGSQSYEYCRQSLFISNFSLVTVEDGDQYKVVMYAEVSLLSVYTYFLGDMDDGGTWQLVADSAAIISYTWESAWRDSEEDFECMSDQAAWELVHVAPEDAGSGCRFLTLETDFCGLEGGRVNAEAG